jgi:ABC-type nitrate/sulfonate/bicarbonate transport system ATPase subunit
MLAGDHAGGRPAKIRIAGVSKAFTNPRSGQVVPAVEDVDLEIATGEFVCILGPSGCGKTTLLNCLAGFVRPDRGRILKDDRAIETPAPDRGMVFQEYALFPWFTVEQNILFGPRMRGVDRRELRELGRRYVELVNLRGFEHHYPFELSGGMKQRVSLARALANDPEILLMDEPFGALDAQTRELLQEELLKIWERDRKTCVFITHSIAEAVYLADRVVVLTARPGRVKRIVPVEIPRLRDRSSEKFFHCYQDVDAVLREEIARAATDRAGLE